MGSPPRDLLSWGGDPVVNRRRGLADHIRAVDVAELKRAYVAFRDGAPSRSERGIPFFLGHDGGGAASSLTSERVRAKAIFDSGPIRFGEDAIRVLDYEILLRSIRADAGIGEIDLIGVDGADRMWILELKVGDNSDTPLKALLQCLRYAAIVEANLESIQSEAIDRFGIPLGWPPVLALVADNTYWQRLLATKPAGDWMAAMGGLIEEISIGFGLEVVILDMGTLAAGLEAGRVRLQQPACATHVTLP